MASLALFDFFPLLCGDHPTKQHGKKIASKVASVPQFVHSNDRAIREAGLKKKRVRWEKERAWLDCQIHRRGKWKSKGQNGYGCRGCCGRGSGGCCFDT